ncbi:MAG: quinolinate synthase NadA [Nitrospirae bacterium]|nr:quinolinate synthase NadA [Candidatus Troglogloeales bacterium]
MTVTEKKIAARIRSLKQERRAIILAHNYQVGEIQDVADFIGDSLELSQKAADTDAEVIVFCGVSFMAETAAVLCPNQIVLMPDLSAGCGMSEMISRDDLIRMKKAHPNAVVVCYVNSSAAVKAESDICCTSSNAKKIVESIPEDREILFIPDQYLGAHVMRQTNRKMILYNGYCPTHVRIMASELAEVVTEHPGAEVLAHPECPLPVQQSADYVLSTSGIALQARKTSAQEVIVATEIGMLHRLSHENPDKEFIPACRHCDCAHMKVNDLEKLLWSLEEMQYPVTVSTSVATSAKRAIDRMLAIG